MKSEQKLRAIQMINAIKTRGSTVSLDAVADLLQEMIWEPDQSEQHLEMVRDAERYRWLRDSVGEHWDVAIRALVGVGAPAEVDAAIDAAIAAEKGETK